jgi:tetratricopeptide (TPR) repeat protein
MNALPPTIGMSLTGNYANAAIPARYAIELGKWDQAAGLTANKDEVAWAQAITWAAIGEGSARSGKAEQAAQAQKQLADLRDAIAKQNNAYWSKQVEVQRLEVVAWQAHAGGQFAEALKTMRAAAELEESMDKAPVTPGAVTPAREMLAEMLLIGKQPKEALVEYQAVLKVAPKRFNALYGAGTAASDSGDNALATAYFKELLDSAEGNERPEMATARKKVSVTAKN